MANPNGSRVLAEAVNHVVRISGTPDCESALQVDTKGSWTFTQLFRLFGTQSRVFVHRREDPLPGFRAESDVFEGRLIRFSDLPFEEAIRSYFASHVGATHFFRPDDIRRAAAAGVRSTVSITDLAGDTVVLGPNDILAFEVKHAGQVEVGLPAARFPNPDAAREALRQARRARARARAPDPGPRDVRPRGRAGRARSGAERRRGAGLPVRPARRARDREGAAGRRHGRGAAAGGQGGRGRGRERPERIRWREGPQTLIGIETVRTLATVQIPPDAYLIVEGETPREHLSDAAIAAVLVAFAGVNLAGLAKSRAGTSSRRKT